MRGFNWSSFGIDEKRIAMEVHGFEMRWKCMEKRASAYFRKEKKWRAKSIIKTILKSTGLL